MSPGISRNGKLAVFHTMNEVKDEHQENSVTISAGWVRIFRMSQSLSIASDNKREI